MTAPCAGTVTAVNVVQGGMASSAQPAVVIAEDSRVKINASVSEDVFAGLHTGDSAGVQISVLSDEVKSAKIVSLPAAANQQTNLYDVSVSVPSGTEPAIGAFATVIFYTCLLYTSPEICCGMYSRRASRPATVGLPFSLIFSTKVWIDIWFFLSHSECIMRLHETAGMLSQRIATLSSPSTSRRRTQTLSSCAVGRFLPI